MPDSDSDDPNFLLVRIGDFNDSDGENFVSPDTSPVVSDEDSDDESAPPNEDGETSRYYYSFLSLHSLDL